MQNAHALRLPYAQVPLGENPPSIDMYASISTYVMKKNATKSRPSKKVKLCKTGKRPLNVTYGLSGSITCSNINWIPPHLARVVKSPIQSPAFWAKRGQKQWPRSGFPTSPAVQRKQPQERWCNRSPKLPKNLENYKMKQQSSIQKPQW